MKKAVFSLMALVAAVLSGCNFYVPKEEADRAVQQRDSVVNEVLRQNNEIAMMQGTLQEVAKELDAINGQIAVSNGEDQDLVSQRNRLLQKLEVVQQTIREKQEQLDELQKKYSSVLSQNKELRKTVERLRAEAEQHLSTIRRYEEKVAEQSAQIEDLTTTLSTTRQTLAETTRDNEIKEEVLSQQDRMLNEGYYIVATKSQLKGMGIIEGGVFNKKRLSTKGFNPGGFTKVDIREVSSIAIPAKSAKILSSHPESSYELVKGSDKQMTLVIRDAADFWSNSKFLVVMI